MFGMRELVAGGALTCCMLISGCGHSGATTSSSTLASSAAQKVTEFISADTSEKLTLQVWSARQVTPDGKQHAGAFRIRNVDGTIISEGFFNSDGGHLILGEGADQILADMPNKDHIVFHANGGNSSNRAVSADFYRVGSTAAINLHGNHPNEASVKGQQLQVAQAAPEPAPVQAPAFMRQEASTGDTLHPDPTVPLTDYIVFKSEDDLSYWMAAWTAGLSDDELLLMTVPAFNTSDQFAKRDIRKRLPEVKQQVAKYVGKRYIAFPMPRVYNLEFLPYDFKRQGFPLDNHALPPVSENCWGSLPPPSPLYLAPVSMQVVQGTCFIPVPDEMAARKIEQQRANRPYSLIQRGMVYYAFAAKNPLPKGTEVYPFIVVHAHLEIFVEKQFGGSETTPVYTVNL